MKKKNISFILFGVAALNSIAALVFLFDWPQIVENVDLGLFYSHTIYRIIGIVGLGIAIVIVIVGIILRIVFRDKD